MEKLSQTSTNSDLRALAQLGVDLEIKSHFVEGETLRQLLKSRKLTLEDAFDIAIQTGAAVAMSLVRSGSLR